MAVQLRSIKGLGPIFVAAILAGAGDLRQYEHGRQLLRKAGLNLAESTSGKRKGQIIISKRGDSSLRKYLYLATIQRSRPKCSAVVVVLTGRLAWSLVEYIVMENDSGGACSVAVKHGQTSV